MSVTINNKPPMNKKYEHRFYEYYGFVDSEGDFFLISVNDAVVRMAENFDSYHVYGSYETIEDFLENEFDTTLIRAYKKDEFDIIINLK